MQKDSFYIMGITLFFLILFAIAGVLSGCGESSDDLQSAGTVERLNFDGHTYIKWAVGYQGGITHDPDCSCNEKD